MVLLRGQEKNQLLIWIHESSFMNVFEKMFQKICTKGLVEINWQSCFLVDAGFEES